MKNQEVLTYTLFLTLFEISPIETKKIELQECYIQSWGFLNKCFEKVNHLYS